VIPKHRILKWDSPRTAAATDEKAVTCTPRPGGTGERHVGNLHCASWPCRTTSDGDNLQSPRLIRFRAPQSGHSRLVHSGEYHFPAAHFAFHRAPPGSAAAGHFPGPQPTPLPRFGITLTNLGRLARVHTITPGAIKSCFPRRAAAAASIGARVPFESGRLPDCGTFSDSQFFQQQTPRHRYLGPLPLDIVPNRPYASWEPRLTTLSGVHAWARQWCAVC